MPHPKKASPVRFDVDGRETGDVRCELITFETEVLFESVHILSITHLEPI